MTPMFPVSFAAQAGAHIPFANLVAWYKASSLVGLADMDPIDGIVDSSGNGNDSAAAGAIRPIYESNEIGGHPSCRFNWGQAVSQQALSVPSDPTLNFGQMTIFAAGNIHGRGMLYGSRTQVWALKNGSAAADTAAWTLYIGDSATSPRPVGFAADIGGFVAALSAVAAIDDTNYVFAGRFDGAELTVWLNGAKIATQAAVGAIPSTTGILQLGGYNASFSGEEYSNSALLELAVYNVAKSDADMLSISNTLQSIYGF